MVLIHDLLECLRHRTVTIKLLSELEGEERELKEKEFITNYKKFLSSQQSKVKSNNNIINNKGEKTSKKANNIDENKENINKDINTFTSNNSNNSNELNSENSRTLNKNLKSQTNFQRIKEDKKSNKDSKKLNKMFNNNPLYLIDNKKAKSVQTQQSQHQHESISKEKCISKETQSKHNSTNDFIQQDELNPLNNLNYMNHLCFNPKNLFLMLSKLEERVGDFKKAENFLKKFNLNE